MYYSVVLVHCDDVIRGQSQFATVERIILYNTYNTAECNPRVSVCAVFAAVRRSAVSLCCDL